MIKRSIVAMVFALISLALFGKEVLTYKTHVDGDTYAYVLSIVEYDDHVIINGVSPEREWTLHCNLNLETKKYEYKNKNDGIDIVLERKDDRIHATGKLGGDPVNKSVKIDKDMPWYQTLGFSFSHFAVSDKSRLEFMMLRPTDLKPIKWVIKKQETESILVNGIPMDAIRLKLNLRGILAPFWRGDLWYRETDGQYVKFTGSNGPPGSPVAVIELISEK